MKKGTARKAKNENTYRYQHPFFSIIISGKLIADPKDHPILNAAIIADVDIIISGDKHFLDLKLEHPKTMSVAEFLDGEAI